MCESSDEQNHQTCLSRCVHVFDIYIYARVECPCSMLGWAPSTLQVSEELKFLTGDETQTMMKAHLQAGLVVGEPFIDRCERRPSLNHIVELDA